MNFTNLTGTGLCITGLRMVAALLILSLLGCGDQEPVTAERYVDSDRLFTTLVKNVTETPTLSQVTAIDHSRLGAETGSTMPPARVLIFSNPELESELIALNPLAALDLPLRVLTYEAVEDKKSYVIANDYGFIRSRYDLPERPDIAAAYKLSLAKALTGIPPEQIAEFANEPMEGNGLITIDSPYDFDTTLQRVLDAIAAQDDTMMFGQVDFQLQARQQGIALNPNTLILFGAPAPGAKAMNKAPTLGLDAFCQKFLVWQDEQGKVYLSFNDLLALAQRQGVGNKVALRVIKFRLNKVFEDALTGG